MQRKEEDAAALAASLEAVAGPPAKFSDHCPGETITYRAGEEIRTGTIIYVQEASQVGSTHTPLTYLVDSDHGWPDLVWQVDIIEPPLWSLPPAD